METQQAIITMNKSAVTPWASRDDVRELGNRIKELLPGANKLQPHEALALAQAAVAHGLDPFNGEIWFIPGRGLMAGIKGHRRSGHNQMQREGGGNYWAEFRGPLSVDELAQIKAPTNALAYECRLYDSKNIATYVDAVSKMTASGVPWEIVKSVMGDRPYTPGIGWYVPGESTKMTPPQVAQKRAEADALKRRFDLPFTVAVGVNGDSDETLGEFTITSDDQARLSHAAEQDAAETQAKMQAASSQLRADQGNDDLVSDAGNTRVGEPIPDGAPYQPEGLPVITQPPEWPSKLLNGLVMHYRSGTVQEYRARLSKSAMLKPTDNIDTIIHWMDIYNKEREIGIEPDEAAKRADSDRQATMESA